MKILKLIGFFVIVAALFVGVSFIKGSEEGSENVPQGADSIFTKLNEKIELEWIGVNTWNQKLFDTQLYRVENNKDYIRKAQSDLLIDAIGAHACAKIWDAMKAELSKSDCKKSEIKKLVAGKKYVVSKSQFASSNANIKSVDSCYTSYKTIREFATKKFKKDPEFNDASWQNYSDYKAGQRKLKEKYLKDPYYKYLKNIDEIKNGLNEIDNKLSSAEKEYYANLSKKIIEYFDAQERTEENKDKLSTCMNRFKKEWSIPDNLRSFRDKFYKEVEKAEQRNQ